MELDDPGAEEEIVNNTNLDNREEDATTNDVDDRPSSRPPKRKRTVGPQLKYKQLRLLPRYTELYNSAVSELGRGIKPPGGGTPLEDSQIGASYWTAAEKNALLNTLASARSNEALQQAVPTKSWLQIIEYMHLLQDRTTTEEDVRMEKVPLILSRLSNTALELGPPCTTTLDLIAEALEVVESSNILENTLTQYGSHGDLTREKALELEAFVASDTPAPEDERENDENNSENENENEQERSAEGEDEHEMAETPTATNVPDLNSLVAETVLPAVKFFDLPIWLQLSENVFMNSSDPEKNWKKLVKQTTKPSILAPALVDFHELAVNLTKRIVPVALFQAQSRHRMLSFTEEDQPMVTRRDVHNALDSLGLPRDSVQIWASIAHRLDIKVNEGSAHKAKLGIDPDVVERVLRSSEYTLKRKDGDRSLVDRINGHIATARAPSEDDDARSSAVEPEEQIQTTAQEQIDAEIDKYLEEVDMRASKVEERRLLELVGDTTQAKKIVLDTGPMPNPPPALFTDVESEAPGAWRKRVDALAEWEEFDTMLLDSLFRNRRGSRNRKSVEAAEEASDDINLDLDASATSTGPDLPVESQPTNISAVDKIDGYGSDKDAEAQDSDSDQYQNNDIDEEMIDEQEANKSTKQSADDDEDEESTSSEDEN